MPYRHYSFSDHICLSIDQFLRTMAHNTATSGLPYPGENVPDAGLSSAERRQAAALMRVNHAGEVCAQALYYGQAAVSQAPATYQQMQQAAMEEGDHLSWCQQRLMELGSHPSYLNPLWYIGSFIIGMSAGAISDQWSLGFIAETERQVIKHLDNHCAKLPIADLRSAAILKKMGADEAKHRDEAIRAGARELPGWVKKLMGWASSIMVKTAYWV